MVSFSFSRSLALVSLVASAVSAVDVDGWRSRSIYQVLTDRFAVAEGVDPKPCDPSMGVHCGGSWRGIYEKLDYIQGMNFDAIWISPIVAQMPNWTGDGEAYPGYWQQNLYELNPAYGSEEDLTTLIDEIHKRGMLFMLDIVVNHMVGPAMVDGAFDYSMMRPFNEEKYFHPYCPSGYSDVDIENLQNCWLGSEQAPLADLKTESQEVRDMLGLWIKNQVWKYGVDGLRIDAAINVPADFFTGFMKDAGVFATSEVYTRQEKLACEWTETVGSILNYPLYWPLTEAFQAEQGSMQSLADMVASIAATCKDPTVMGTFSENHDVARFRNHTADLARARNVATYLLTADGIPVVYYGIEQHLGGNVEPYFNRQALWEEGFSQDSSIYKLFATLNLFRRHMGRQYPDYLTTLSKDIGIDANTIAWAKGADKDPKVISVLSNKGQDASDYSMELCDGHGYSAGDELLDVVACKSTTVGNNGCLTVWVTDGEPVVMVKKTALEGSTLCGVSGDSKVVLESQAIISTTWTSMVSGSPSVFHTATTVPWADAPASITSTSSTAAAAKATSTGGKHHKNNKRHEHHHHHALHGSHARPRQ